MKRQLETAREQLPESSTLEQVQSVADSAATLMLDEQREWLGVMLSHELKLRDVV